MAKQHFLKTKKSCVKQVICWPNIFHLTVWFMDSEPFPFTSLITCTTTTSHYIKWNLTCKMMIDLKNSKSVNEFCTKIIIIFTIILNSPGFHKTCIGLNWFAFSYCDIADKRHSWKLVLRTIEIIICTYCCLQTQQR